MSEAADIVFAAGEATIDRSTVEQLLRGNMAIIEESLLGESADLRSMYLDVAVPVDGFLAREARLLSEARGTDKGNVGHVATKRGG